VSARSRSLTSAGLACLAFASFVSLAPTASAAFVSPDGVNAPWVRGITAHSAWAEWQNFGTGAGPNAPDAGTFADGSFSDGSPAWNARDISGFGLVTGGGNLYGPGGALTVQVDIPAFDLGEPAITTVWLQVRTLGTEVLPGSVLLGGAAAVEVTELSRTALGGFGGFQVETLWRFEVAADAAGHAIVFSAAGPHMSVDALSVDAFTQVPGPGAAALLLGAWALPTRRRSRSRH